MTMRDTLVRGMLAGIFAAVLALGFAYVFGEPEVNSAIAFEDAHASADDGHSHTQASAAAEPGVHTHAEEEAIVSRGVQSTIGLATGLGMIGVAFGGLFAIAFALAYGRLGALGIRGTALVVALLGFTALYLIPFLKYPPNPPATGDPDTIAQRTVLYFGMLIIALAATVGAVILQRRLAADGSEWNASIVAGAAFLLVIAGAMLLLPGINEVPIEFPATVLYQFRLASLGMQLVLWGGIGLTFGMLTDRAARAQR